MLLILILFISNIILSQCTGLISTDANPSNISPGDVAKIIYSLTNNGAPCISAINIDISFDSNIFNPPEISCGTASSSVGKICQGNLISEGNYRVIIYGGITTISNG